ncbi:MAG TPA: DNA repair protein RecO [Phnomibacter sp.]|nr:DNA repair protein RecO [Phnomibacter sp.]
MLQPTRAIILKTVPYSETSLVVHAFTEAFGLQQYLVKGARRVSKKGNSSSSLLQPAALLDMVVYSQPQKNLNIIKEMKWALVYRQVMSSISRHAVALYLTELLTKCLKQPEQNPELFNLAEQSLRVLDACEPLVAANLPLHFTLQVAAILGFGLTDDFTEQRPILDLQEGNYVAEPPPQGLYLDPTLSQITHQLLQHSNPVTLYRLKLNQHQRRSLLNAYQQFYQHHVAEFGYLRTLPVLQEVLGEG